MLDYLVLQTNMTDFMTKDDLSQLRQTCQLLKESIDQFSHPYTWVQACRLCDPTILWGLDDHRVSCHQPVKNEWMIFYWLKRLPSIIPPGFWSYFLRFMKGYVSMTNFRQWRSFTQQPLFFPDRHKRWYIGMRVEIVGNSEHNEAFYPEELKDIDEFISVGVSISHTKKIQESIPGLNPSSVGWHSDDGSIYMDSLMVGEATRFGRGDQVDVIVDYYTGMIMFEKNSRVAHIQELSGEFLCNPLMFTVVCKTMNHLSFHII